MDLKDIRRQIIDQIPPDVRFTPADAAVIARHAPLLASMGEDVVKGFYDLAYGHPATAAVFREGERPAREDTLRTFWGRVVSGPLDDAFFDWMTFVGLVHVTRKVKNPMMLAAWGNIVQMVGDRASRTLTPEERCELLNAFMRLGHMITSLVADSYLKGIAEATGSSLALLENLAAQQAQDLVAAVRPSR